MHSNDFFGLPLIILHNLSLGAIPHHTASDGYITDEDHASDVAPIQDAIDDMDLVKMVLLPEVLAPVIEQVPFAVSDG